jgi:hypothetical protein
MSLNDPIGPEKYDAYQEPQYASPPEKKGPGCLFWGCLISGILFVVFIILMVALVFFVRGKIVDVMREYTEPTPAELPEIQLADAERQAVVDRWEEFRTALDQGQEAELSLTSEEFNVVAQQVVPEAADHAFFTVEGDQLLGQVSVPVEQFGQKLLGTDQLDGRFFNASGTFDVFLRNGLLVLQLQDAEVKGEPVPDEAMQQIRTQNLAENLANDPEKRDLFSKFQRIEVKDGKIIMTSKGIAPAEADAEGSAVEPDAVEAEASSEPEAPAAEPEAPAAEPEAPATETPEEAPGADEPAEAPEEEPAGAI